MKAWLGAVAAAAVAWCVMGSGAWALETASDEPIQLAQASAPAANDSPMSAASALRATPAIWRVEKGNQRSWLMGTMHVLPDLNWKSSAVRTAVAVSDLFVFEIEVDRIDPVMATKYMTQYGVLSGGRTLSGILGTENWLEVVAFAQELGVSPAELDKTKPWLASLLISQQYFLSKGFDPDRGVEAELLKQLRLEDRDTTSLESMEQQFQFMDGLSEPVSVAMLMSTIRDIRSNPNMARKMLTAWASGDTVRLENLVNETLRDFPEAYDSLLIARNRSWVPRLIALMEQGKTVFVAVGSGHLVGRDNVVQLLREAGYTVTRERRALDQ